MLGGLLEAPKSPFAAIVGGVVLWVWPGQTLIVAGYFLAGVAIQERDSDDSECFVYISSG